MTQTLKTFRGLFDFLQRDNPQPFKLKDKQRKALVYRYPKSNHGNEFVLELMDESLSKYYMTGFGAGIKIGDFIVIEDRDVTATYQVENIDYYLEPSDMWIALLQKCSH